MYILTGISQRLDAHTLKRPPSDFNLLLPYKASFFNSSNALSATRNPSKPAGKPA